MIDDPGSTDSLTRIQKAKICSSLLRKIRVIQGHTNLNYNEPLLIESKDSVCQTKNIIKNIKEGLKKGCSELIRNYGERNSCRFHSDTTSTISENKRTKKHQTQKTHSGQISENVDSKQAKQAKQKKYAVQEMVNFYEGGEHPIASSSVKFSQILVKNENDDETDAKSDKKKKRKRKGDEYESISSLTASRSKCDLVKASRGDISTRPKSRKMKEKTLNRRRPECSGDESDFEDDLPNKPYNQVERGHRNPNKVRKKLRPKRPKSNSSNLAFAHTSDNSGTPNINEMVSTTIQRLNTVNENVKRIIEDSLSSPSTSERGSMASLNTLVNSVPAKTQLQTVENPKMVTEQLSTSSLNWSTVTNDISEISTAIVRSSLTETQRQNRVPSRKISKKQSVVKSKPQLIEEVPPKESTTETASPRLEEVTATKIKKKQHKHLEEKVKVEKVKEEKVKEEKIKEEKIKEEKVKEETEKPAGETPRRKRSSKSREAQQPSEPVSSMKKIGKKKRSKKHEHVNFASTPELVPDSIPQPIIPKASIRSVRDALNETIVPEKPPSPTKSIREEIANSSLKKQKSEPTRRVKSAKMYRNVHKKITPKVKSTSNISPEKHPKTPISVRTVLQEEAKNLEEMKRQRSRSRSGSRPSSRNGSRPRSQSRNRPTSQNGIEEKKSRDVMEIYRKICTNTTSTIATANEQISSTLKEGIAHLNDICGKVRTTLTDMEKDEETYKKLKYKQSFDVSSECGSVPEGGVLSEVSMKPGANQTKEPQPHVPSSPPTTQTYTVITESRPDTSIGQLMNTLSMAGDNVVVERYTPPTTQERKKRPGSSRSKRRRPSLKVPKTPPTSKTRTPPRVTSTSTIKSNSARIPIWQRTPPSVIEEIQLTVKKQATKSQYREFLRALKTIARRQRSQVHVMPTEYKDLMEKQQDKAFSDTSKQKPSYILTGKRRKEGKPADEIQANDVCQDCSNEKCTCGVVVENTQSLPNQYKNHWMHIRPDAKRGIQAYDILDEITLKDLEPIQSEYPRKDHISDTNANERIEETLLYKLLYHEDPKVLETLLRSTPTTDNKTQSHISNAASTEKQKSASNAYKLYEQLEFNNEKDKPQINTLSTTRASMSINGKVIPKSTEKPKPIHMCPKEFNDEVNIPMDLKPVLKTKAVNRKLYHIKVKSDGEKPSSRSAKKIEDKLKIIRKTSSMKSISKRIKAGKMSRENIKAKLKSYKTDSKLKIKKVITVMPVSILQKGHHRRNKRKIPKLEVLTKVEKEEENSARTMNLEISDTNLAKIRNMSKREIVQTLKPYIFYDLQPPVIIAMPVSPKYNHQNKQQKQDHISHINKGPTYKRVASFLKDHDDDCRTGRKLCRRCQLSMQSGDETKRGDTVASRRSEPLSQRQLWKNKYRSTPAENLVTRVLGKSGSKKKFEAVPPDEKPGNKDMVINATPKELNKNATNTRNKLKKVKTIMESHKTLLGQDLDEIIDTLEFKIVDALANPKNQHTDAFNDIEHEIKSILDTISELKEINKENLRQSDTKLKSKTTFRLEDSSDQTVSSSNKSYTDVDLLNRDKSILDDETDKLSRTVHVETPTITKKEEAEKIEEMREKELDNTYCNLGQDIQKVIQGLDAIMTLDEEEEQDSGAQTDTKVTVINEDSREQPIEDGILPSECEDAVITFCQQVDEVIKTIGNMDDLNGCTSNLDGSVEVHEKKSDEFLTPFMKAVKDYRENDTGHSFVEFLDKLAVLSKDSVALHIYPNIPLYRTTLQQSAQIIEVAKTYNQAIQHEEVNFDKGVDAQLVSGIDKAVGESRLVTKDEAIGDGGSPNKPDCIEDKFFEACACADEIQYQTITRNPSIASNEDVLSTNHWMQTETFEWAQDEESKNKLIQTVSTSEQFNEIEEYMSTLDYVMSSKPTLLISEKKTQYPSDIDHSCFAETSTKDSQVTSDLIAMTSVAIGNQKNYASIEVISAECQVFASETNLIKPDDEDEHPADLEKVSLTTINTLEKYTNSRLENCLAPDISDVSFDEYPRNVYTESYISREKYEQITDSLFCRKRNSYPVMKIPQNPSNIISLFENRKSCSRDFLEEGFGKTADSYDSMLVRYASSENMSTNPSSATVEKPETNPTTAEKNETEEGASIASETKLIVEKTKCDGRHKHILHSVYGIVFTLMFLGINLNYTCCN